MHSLIYFIKFWILIIYIEGKCGPSSFGFYSICGKAPSWRCDDDHEKDEQWFWWRITRRPNLGACVHVRGSIEERMWHFKLRPEWWIRWMKGEDVRLGWFSLACSIKILKELVFMGIHFMESYWNDLIRKVTRTIYFLKKIPLSD